MLRRVHLIIKGLVQGVSFRYYTILEAKRLEITGWVRNLPDGSVEITAEGEEYQLKEFITWTNHGPRYAEVTHCIEQWFSYKGEFTEFTLMHSKF